MHICVLGGGVTGVTAAYFLARDGHQVTIVDRELTLGQGASHSNGAQLSYSYVAPLAGPATLRDVPAYMLQKDGPLQLRPGMDPDQWRWCLDFLRACGGMRSLQTTAELLSLGQYSRLALHDILDAHQLEFDFTASGKLVLYRDAAAFTAARRLVDFQATLGSDQRALDAQGCAALEPALEALVPKLAGGIYTQSEETGDCSRFVQALGTVLARRFGTALMLGQALTGLRSQGSRIVAAQTAEGDIAADGFIIALGNGAARLVRPLGIRLPIYPLRGYSLTAKVAPGNASPRTSITDLHHKVVYAPLGDRLRVAEMVDIGRASPAATARRIQLLKDQARETLPDAADFQEAETWCGARPATPDGKPLVGPTRFENLWLNTGHGGLGFTLACGTGRLLSDHIGRHRTALPLGPFLLGATRNAGLAA